MILKPPTKGILGTADGSSEALNPATYRVGGAESISLEIETHNDVGRNRERVVGFWAANREPPDGNTRITSQSVEFIIFGTLFGK